MAKGFRVEGIPLCCVCAKWYADESGYPQLFFQVNPMIDMDDHKKCVCGRLPGASDCLKAATMITNYVGDRKISDTTACNAIMDTLSVFRNAEEIVKNITTIIHATGRRR